MVHVNLVRKWMYIILAFLVVLTVSLWKEIRKGYYISLKLESPTDLIPVQLWRWGTVNQDVVQDQVASDKGKAFLPTRAVQVKKKENVSLTPAGSNLMTKSKKLTGFIKVWNKDSSSRNLIPRLQKARKNYLSMNKYHVNFSGPRNAAKPSPKKLLCQLRERLNFQMIQASDGPFSTTEWEAFLPKRNISTEIGHFGQCAVVSSAGSMKSSYLGTEIGLYYSFIKENQQHPIKIFGVGFQYWLEK